MTPYTRFTAIFGIFLFSNMPAASTSLQIIDDSCSSSSSSSSSPISARPHVALSALFTDTPITICGQNLASPKTFPPTFYSLSPLFCATPIRPLSVSPEPVIDTSLCKPSVHCISVNTTAKIPQDTASDHLNNLRPYHHPIDAAISIWRHHVTTIMSELENDARIPEMKAHIIYFIHKLNQRDFTVARIKIFNDACKEWLEIITKKHAQRDPATDPSCELNYWKQHLDEFRPFIKENKKSIIAPSHA